MIKINYVDNSGNFRELDDIDAATFRDAVQAAETFANEAGWGIRAIILAVRTVEVSDE